ncbi:MAG: ABC transporter permease [Clostridiales Family XIII bacterium]|jgi:putative ABC transport system permease protein|nr:ABC transporter permease [Clostridiales Family XIII bacterium]
MSFKIAIRNVRKSFRDYTVYFLTLTFGVCVFYVFNSIDGQQAIMELTSGQSTALRAIDRIMEGFSVFISCVLGFLIIYANGFLIRRRKKEFGIYMTLGMNRSRISRILVFETVSVGLLSLFAGILLGVFLSQGMAILTAGLLGAGIGDLRFIFSASALRAAVVYFGLTFILILAFNIVMVRRQKLIDLIYADRRNEGFRTPRLGVSVLIFVASLLCLAAAYMIATYGGIAALTSLLPLASGLGVAGTFMFFLSLSGFFLKLFRQNRRLYLRNLNMFVLRQINSRINTAYVSMTFVCLMLFVSICALSSGMGMAGAIAGEMRANTPFDATLAVSADSGGAGYEGVDLLGALGEKGVDLAGFAKEYAVLRYYDAGIRLPIEMDGERGELRTYLIRLSDYNALLGMQGIEPVSLGQGEYALASGMTNAWPAALAAYMDGGPSIEIGGETLRTGPSRLYRHALETALSSNSEVALIVSDGLAEGLPAKGDAMHINYLQGGEGGYEALCKKSLSRLAFSGPDGAPLQASLTTRAEVMENSNSATTTVAYLAVYLGVIFLIASATVLAIAQLSEASDNARRYGLLRKMGTDDRMLNGALTAQITIYFGVPLALALVHSFVGINMASRLIGALGDMDILGSSLFTAAVILIIYGGYFLATCLGAKNMLNKEYAQNRG